MHARITSFVLNLLFPEKCVGCKKEGTFLCADCLVALPGAESALLPANITALFAYRNNVVKKAIKILKYRGAKSVAKAFAAPLYEELLAGLGDALPDKNARSTLLVPVPLSAKKLRERGWNQAEWLAEETARLDENGAFEPRPDIVQKIKHTPSQTSFRNKKARLKNIKDCFAVKKPEDVRGRRMVIIDDVCTTGATVREVQKVLKAAGAKHVSILTVAH